MSTPGYVYYIKNKVTGQYYYGSRTANVKRKRPPSLDLWICYFTSSKTVKNLIKQYGKQIFEACVIFESADLDAVYWQEQSFIKEHIEDSLCLNKKYQDQEHGHTIFSTANKPPWNLGTPSKYRGVPRDPKTIALISANRKGKGLGVIPPNKGIPMSPERYEQHMESMALRKKLTGHDNPFYGRTHSEETRKKIAANTSRAQKGKPKPKKACPICGRGMAAHTLGRHINAHSS
jgi:hypothetical protein